MPTSDEIFAEIMTVLRRRLGAQIDHYHFPPPVFAAMQGEFLALNLEEASLTVRFPILANQLNPYGSMQGGIIAAAIDNTVGPLSVLVAPPNVTRHLELTYSKPVRAEVGWITVRADLIERQDRRLTFKAEVFDPQKNRLVRARAEHWIITS